MRRLFFSYLSGNRMLDAIREPRYVVRVFHPRGQYPKACIAQPEGLFIADEEIAFCVTLATLRKPLEDDWPYTEMDWLSLEELRFLASLYLCERGWEAWFRFYPLPNYSPIINRTRLDLTKASVQSKLRWTIIHHLRNPQSSQIDKLHECLSLRYSLIEGNDLDLSRQPLFWKNISTKDYILLRGISALLRSDMLSTYMEFYEEATIACFIALEASFQLIRRRLKDEGMNDPSAKDAATWLHNNFDSKLGREVPQVERYFEEFYDQRIMTLHPLNRFGEHVYAPLMHDDQIHLRPSLRSIFAFLVSGEHDSEFLEEARKNARFDSEKAN